MKRYLRKSIIGFFALALVFVVVIVLYNHKQWYLEGDSSVKLTINGNRYSFTGSGDNYNALIEYLETKQGYIEKTETGYICDSFIITVQDEGELLLIQKSPMYSTTYRFIKK